MLFFKEVIEKKRSKKIHLYIIGEVDQGGKIIRLLCSGQVTKFCIRANFDVSNTNTYGSTHNSKFCCQSLVRMPTLLHVCSKNPI